MNKTCKEEGILFQENGKPVPLTGVEVTGNIVGRGAKVKVSQKFRNTEKESIEAVYKFPLPENAAVCGFRALIDERIVEGRIEEREKAYELYDKALARGDKAQLMDEERPNIFTISVGNIKPGSTVVIEISYITLLDSHNSEVRFYLPTTISPRYIPRSQGDENGIPVRDIVNPKFALDVPYGLHVNITVNNRKAITSIESPSHAINVRFDGDDAAITFASDAVPMDQDFILTIAYDKESPTMGFMYTDGDETFMQIDIMPDETGEAGRPGIASESSEIIFVLDCSGSMSGDSIAEARKALDILIRALNPGIRFNIYRFGTTFEKLFPSSKSYDESSMQEAVDYLACTDATLGGTEILAPLKEIYMKDASRGQYRDLIVITDGEISNESEVMRLVERHADSTAVSTVGIGSGPNEFLIKGVARAAGGVSAMINPGERIEPKILRLFEKVMAGGISDLKIDCGVEIDQSPACPVAHARQVTSIFAKLESGKPHNKTVRVTGKSRAGAREWMIDLDELHNTNDLPISRLWARGKIMDLEEGSWRSSGNRKNASTANAYTGAVIDLSKKYGIISRSTSYIGIEKRSTTEEISPDIVLRPVPVCITKGWHGMPSRVFPSHSSSALKYMMISSLGNNAVSDMNFSCQMNFSRVLHDGPTSRIKRSIPRTEDKDPLLDLLSLQKAGGGFSQGKVMTKYLKVSLPEIKDIAKKIEMSDRKDRLTILVTIFVLIILELKFSDRRDEWEGIVQKSRNWLQERIDRNNPVISNEPLEQWGRMFIEERLFNSKGVRRQGNKNS